MELKESAFHINNFIILKILFVTSGNSKDFEIAPFVRAQGESSNQWKRQDHKNRFRFGNGCQ